MEIRELYNIYKKNPVICTDTRRITKGSLFFALKGENFNGNKFAEKAIKEGCSFAIIDEGDSSDNQFILVHNVLQTLQKLAKYHRERLSIPVIGITGTNGKTTSKELTHHILESELNCYATKGNLNNTIGVPLSILEINSKHDIAIIEMGANHEKEIDFLCDIARPTYGAITNIGTAHLEGFKDPEGIIRTKNELYKFIKSNKSTLFINNDDNLLVELATNISQVCYGINSDLDVSINDNSIFLNVKWKDTIIKSKMIGDYQFYNISLAICISNYFNISKRNIKRSIESYIPKNNRSEIIETNSNIIILDAYNANPSSMKAMLDSFAKQKHKNKLCILGDMLELGDYSTEEHSNIIKYCKELELACIFVGDEFGKVNTETFKNTSNLKKFIKNNPIEEKTILLKGSRGIRLEDLVNVL